MYRRREQNILCKTSSERTKKEWSDFVTLSLIAPEDKISEAIF